MHIRLCVRACGGGGGGVCTSFSLKRGSIDVFHFHYYRHFVDVGVCVVRRINSCTFLNMNSF